DAATRMVDAVVRAGGLSKSDGIEQLVERLSTCTYGDGQIPEGFWTARPTRRKSPAGDEGTLLLQGAVLVTVRGPGTRNARLSAMGLRPPETQLSADLIAALREPTRAPWRELARMLREDGLLTPAILVGAMFVSAATVAGQALVLRGLLDLGRSLGIG